MRIEGEIIGANRYVELSDDTVWPSIERENQELEWIMRYGSPGDIEKRRMYVASIIHAYLALINKPQRRRNAICSAIKKAKKPQPK